MIIKEFAKLCDCNPQTLRYYDSIDLLKPVNVDKYTGYRHYNVEQALQYLKIKKLQDAGFSIEEIKKLINASDDVIFDALNKKILEQESKLLEIKKIQKSYQKEMKEMKEKIASIKEKMMSSALEVDYKDEFGISKDEFYEIIKAANTMLDNSLSDEIIDFATPIDEDDEIVSDDLSLVYEVNNFKRIKDVINSIPDLSKGEYVVFVIADDKYKDNYAYVNTVVSMIVEKTPGKDFNLKISFDFSKEKQSFKIYKKI